MSSVTYYQCTGCDAEFEVKADRQPTVVCPECRVVAKLRDDVEAVANYRVGHAHYTEGRRQLGAGLSEGLSEGEYTHARAYVTEASDDFETAVEQFRTAAEQAMTDPLVTSAENARERSECLWRAADWLSGALFELRQGRPCPKFKKEAQTQLERAETFDEPPDPDTLGEAEPASN